MTQVELVEDGPGAGPAPGGPRHGDAALRRVVRLLAPPAAALLAVSLLADAAAECTRAAAFAEVRGVLQPGQSVRPVWELGPRAELVLDGVVLDGTLVGALAGETTLTGFVGLDPDSGARRWEMAAAVPDDLRATELWAGCDGVDGLAVCFAYAWSGEAGGGEEWQAAWVLDPADGRPVRSWRPPDDAGMRIAGRSLVEYSGLDGEGRRTQVWSYPDRVRLTALDPATGAERWVWTSVAIDDLGEGPWDAWPLGDQTLVTRGARGWLVDDADGAARELPGVASVGSFAATRTGQVFQVRYAAVDHGSLLREDGTWAEVPGTVLALAVDDGSAPGLAYFRGRADDRADDRGTLASDATGAVRRWAPAEGELALLLDGVLVVADGTSVTALDALTGQVAWSVDLDTAATDLGADGTAVLVARDPATVSAFDLHDGRPLWERDALAAVEGPGVRWDDEQVRLGTAVARPVLVRADGSAVVLR